MGAEPNLRPSSAHRSEGTSAVADRELTEPGQGAERDRGMSLTEVVVAISLMGLVVVTVLGGIATIVKASSIDRDHANTFEWLQAASDAVHREPRVPCTSDGTGRLSAIASYDAAAQTATMPVVFDGTTASIEVTNVEYLGRITADDEFEWGESFCFEGTGFDDSPLYTQRVTIEVVLESGGPSQRLEMVKSE